MSDSTAEAGVKCTLLSSLAAAADLAALSSSFLETLLESVRLAATLAAGMLTKGSPYSKP